MEREKMTELTSRLATRTADIEKLETANQRIEAEHSSLEKQITALKQRQ
jgi:cell division protein FtsB